MKYCSNCGKQLRNEDTFCDECGSRVAPTQSTFGQSVDGVIKSAEDFLNKDSGSELWTLLGVFFPVVGLILYLLWKDSHPQNARKAGRGALYGAIIYGALIILALILSFIPLILLVFRH